MQADVQTCQSLLAIEDRGDVALVRNWDLLRVTALQLMEVAHHVVEGVVLRVGSGDLPEQEGADRILAQQAVKEVADLGLRPDELALNGWDHVVVAVDAIQRLGHRQWNLKCHNAPVRSSSLIIANSLTLQRQECRVAPSRPQ